MTDQHPSSLENLTDKIREIERETKQPSQLIILIGKDKYLVGDLRKRTGEYRLELDDKLPLDQEQVLEDMVARHEGKEVPERTSSPNPYKNLEDSYQSIDELKNAIKATHKGQGEGLYLIGSPEHGYSAAIQGRNMGSAGGQMYQQIGKVISPLLQDGEKASVVKISRDSD